MQQVQPSLEFGAFQATAPDGTEAAAAGGVGTGTEGGSQLAAAQRVEASLELGFVSETAEEAAVAVAAAGSELQAAQQEQEQQLEETQMEETQGELAVSDPTQEL
jgi:hypothetical protein